MKRITLGVKEFALPAPRRGSIDVFSGFGRASQLGIELHQQVQAERAKSHSSYQAEVALQRRFERGGYGFDISGRMDGFFAGLKPKIEEIKTSFNIYELSKRLRDAEDEHPYCLQVRTYGYFHWLEHQVVPELSLFLVSTRNGDELTVNVDLDVRGYEAWMERRFAELVEQAQRAEKKMRRRKKVAQALAFPFERPRSGQLELISTIEEGMKDSRPLLIQAPTGLGKTVGVLYPALREALGRGQKVVYITPKNSQHSVAEDAIERLQATGAKVKSLTITAKSKICFKNEPLCNPEYCEYAKDHYTKVAENKVLEQLALKRKLTEKTFRKLGEAHQVCPFELQLDAATEADTVICDYNYVFAPRSAFGRLAGSEFESGLEQNGKPNLVIDEAHNLPSRAMDYYSPELSTVVLERMRENLKALPLSFQKEAQDLLDECLKVVRGCGVEGKKGPFQIQPPVAAFLDQDASLKAFLSSYLNADVSIEPRDPVLRLSFYWSEFTAALEFVSSGRKEFFTTFTPEPASVKITCCDPSELMKNAYDEYGQVVAFSATLKPFEYYSRLSGLEEKAKTTAEFTSPFPKERRKILIIPQVSSKFSERQRNSPRIADAIRKISELRRGNYFAFFPSFDFMERVLREFSPPEGFVVLRQERSMRRNDVDEVLERLKEGGRAHVVFAVQGGVFSEGVDYPGEMIIGAFIVGPPLPNFDLEQEKRREYYERHYQAGFDYAYTYPAMAKAVQAAGRVIRSETDRGLIVLMDDRFIQTSYAKSMPQDWFEHSPRELVSQSILKEVSEFWSRS